MLGSGTMGLLNWTKRVREGSREGGREGGRGYVLGILL